MEKRKSGIVRIFSWLLLCVMTLSACQFNTDVQTSEMGGTPKPSEDSSPAMSSDRFSEENSKNHSAEETPALCITELMVHNRFCIANGEGKYLPWIEIFNGSSEKVMLGEYTLNIENCSHALPDRFLEAGEYFLFFVEELPAKGKLVLKHAEKITDEVIYLNEKVDFSFITENGSETEMPTPGYAGVKSADTLIFSEIMPLNTAYPVDGVAGAYIELYNPGTTGINLENFWLSDRTDDRYLCRLPAVVLGAGEYLALPCEGALHFALSVFESTLYLTRNDGVLAASVNYPKAEKNLSYCEGNWQKPSPGYPNTEEGMLLYAVSRKGLLINEVLPANTKYYAQSGKYYDLVELKNTGNETLQLADYYISDSHKNLKKYRLPEKELKPGELYVVVCTGTEGRDCPFKLSSEGELLIVSNKEGKISDVLEFPSVPVNRSWGRSGNDLVYFAVPSIGRENGSGFRTISEEPKADRQSGFYDAAFEVTLSGKGEIHYTLDGSRPTLQSPKYDGRKIAVNQNTTIRALAAEGEKIESGDVTFNYFINALDVELPVVKLSVLHEDMYGSEGIYTDYKNYEKEIEGHVAFYVDGKEEFSVNCGVKLFGNYSRVYTKKSFHLKFKSEYGCSSLKYDVFGDGSVTEFENIVLRSGSQDHNRTMMRDEFASGTVLDYCPSLLAQNYRPVNLYINEEYIGIYYFREKINEDFVAYHWKVSPGSVTIIENMNYVEKGSAGEEWFDLYRFIKNNDLTVEENYRYICDRMSIDSIIDYHIVYCWADNRDSGNTRLCKSDQYDDGKWHFIYYDSDLGFGIYLQDDPSTAHYLYGTEAASWRYPNTLIRKLLMNEEFKEQFLKRLSELCDKAFAPETVAERIEGLRQAISHDMQFVRSGYGIKKESWEKITMPQLVSYTADRAKNLEQEFSDLLNLSEQERRKYFG